MSLIVGLGVATNPDESVEGPGREPSTVEQVADHPVVLGLDFAPTVPPAAELRILPPDDKPSPGG